MAFRQNLQRLTTASAAMAVVTSGALVGRSVAWAAEKSVEPPAPVPPAPPPPPRNDNPRTTAAGFDPEALERGAKALREINSSPYAKKVFETMKKQEETRQAEEKARQAEYQAQQAQHETERQRVIYEEQRKLTQQQAQTKAQLARYEDELSRKRMQADHEAQRARNVELVRLQEESAQKQEMSRRATEEQVQAQRRQTERERAELERETLRVKAMAEAEARAHEARLSEDVNRKMMLERAGAERDKLLAAINTTFAQIGVTALAAGVYTSREGARVVWGYVDRILGQPSLVRESSRGKYPWSRFWRSSYGASSSSSSSLPPALLPEASSTQAASLSSASSGAAGASSAAGTSSAGGSIAGGGLATQSATEMMRSGRGFGDVVLHPSLHKRIRQLAAATAHTKTHGAPFRNMLFYGPPGTGKTMAAKELARQSGLDYALMTGGDVAPLGAQAVTKIHQLFDWASKTRQGLLLFIDEADAFLCEVRTRSHISKSLIAHTECLVQRLNIQQKILLIRLYLHRYVVAAGAAASGGATWRGWAAALLRGRPQSGIEVKGVSADVIREAAEKTEGFSGREVAKLMASVQGAVYGSKESVLTAEIFREVVDYKVAEHRLRRQLAADGAASK
eukprot:jgi/Mesen1/6051/ME000308S05241